MFLIFFLPPPPRREGLATLEAGLQKAQSESMTKISTLQARLTASERQEDALVLRNEASEAEIERLKEDARKRSATVLELENRVMLLETPNPKPYTTFDPATVNELENRVTLLRRLINPKP